jgi:hypothetical protein
MYGFMNESGQNITSETETGESWTFYLFQRKQSKEVEDICEEPLGWNKAETQHEIDQPLKISQWERMMAHACNFSYMGGWDWEDLDLRPAQANGL